MAVSERRIEFVEFCKKALKTKPLYLLRQNIPKNIFLYGRRYGFWGGIGSVVNPQYSKITLLTKTPITLCWFFMLKNNKTPLRRMFLAYTCSQHRLDVSMIHEIFGLYERSELTGTYPAIYPIVHLQLLGKCTSGCAMKQIREAGYNIRLAARWNESYILAKSVKGEGRCQTQEM